MPLWNRVFPGTPTRKRQRHKPGFLRALQQPYPSPAHEGSVRPGQMYREGTLVLAATISNEICDEIPLLEGVADFLRACKELRLAWLDPDDNCRGRISNGPFEPRSRHKAQLTCDLCGYRYLIFPRQGSDHFLDCIKSRMCVRYRLVRCSTLPVLSPMRSG